MNYLSFFSGALGLDLGFEESGFTPLLYCEIDKSCQKTISINKPNIPLITDIEQYTAEDILRKIQGKRVDVIIGGPPCQAFSTAGKRKGLSDSRGNVFLKYLEIATTIKPKYIIIENVRGLLSASHNETKGGALALIVKILENNGYLVTFNLYNAANFGAPQARERVIITATLSNKKVPYLQPTHSNKPEFGLPAWRTFGEVAPSTEEKNDDFLTIPAKRLKYFELLKPGQNWTNLPVELQKEALGKAYELGGGKTGFIRRLDWNKPSPTLVTSPLMPATSLVHPTENRSLSVKEYARIQEFPDHWTFAGTLSDKYKQIGNAVPISLSRAVAICILNHHKNKKVSPILNFPYSRYKKTSDLDFLMSNIM